MWRIALVLAVVAGCCDACPESCECHNIPDTEDLAALVEAVCLGRAPRLIELSSTTRRLRITDTDETEVLGFLEDLANGTTSTSLPYLDEFEFSNCSLTSLNGSSWPLALEKMRTLNISRNDLADLEDVGIIVKRVNVSSLATFDVSDNRLDELSAFTFRTLPVLARLCLKGNRISRIDAEAFVGLGSLEELDLSDNRLESLPDSALTPLESLQKLDLSGNQLQVLGAGWFESLGRLRELDVSRNGLARAASGALQPLPGLSVLRLAGNPLRERDVSLLLGTGRKLETVDASRTGLIRVPAALTRSVRALRLAGNKLTSIRGGDLDSYPLLRLLDMSDNRLTDVEEDALGRLEVLEDLDLSGNSLTDVPRSLPGSLTALNLDRNRVKILRFNDLQGLYNLGELHLRDNAIVEIQEGAISQLSALRVLDISDNPIEKLPANTLNGPTRLDTLKMSGLTALQWDQRDQGDMTFPVPAPERLVDLDVSRSPVLAAQLLADTAALSACKSLLTLNLEQTNLTTLRSDLIYFVPQLRVLGLGGNPWCCTEDIYWLGDWSRDHEELEPLAECEKNVSSSTTGIYLRELPSPPTPASTSLATPQELGEKNTGENHPEEPDANATSSYLEVFRSRGSTEEDYPPVDNSTLDLNSTIEYAKTEVYVSPTTRSTSLVTKRPSIRNKENRVAERDSQSILMNGSHRLAPQRNREDILTRSTTAAADHKTTRALRRKDTKVTKKGEDDDKKGSEDDGEADDLGPRNKRKEIEDGSANTVAEELQSGRATDSGARISEALSAGAHPGMLVLVGAALGAVAALSVVLSRRATARRRDCCYQRQENIEVHTLTPVTELW